jgi:D-sedoheptulose 7-phosphate isomerase
MHETVPTESASRLRAIVGDRFKQSMSVPEGFFRAEADRIALACWDMAKRFHRGGRLIAFGNGAAASDAQHISVEFVHPVIVGKRALPALALTNDGAFLNGEHASFADRIAVLGRPHDIALGLSPDGNDPNVLKGLRRAHDLGMLTVGLEGGGGGGMAHTGLDHHFLVSSTDAFAVQETHETLYHVLWELVHVFFEHEGLLNN